MNLLRKLWIVALAALMAATVSCSSPTGAGSESSTAPPPPAAGSCTLGLGADAPDDEVIRAVLLAEGEFVVEQDIDALMQLWAPDSRVVDAKNTPDDDADDQNWDGKDAIRHRYVRTVFPGSPDQVQPSDLEIAIDGDEAVVHATTHIGSEISPAGDRWELVRIDGCWLIRSLTYNLEAHP
ncbi:MAG: nuclear transport factor 2 family protein [Chloroflexota bacterium]|nr:nuclear transport factor 2 family protein [Chloroflexota bacterium]